MTKSYWRKLTGGKKPDINNILNKFKSFLKTYDESKYDDEDYEEDYMKASRIFQSTLSSDEQSEMWDHFHPENFNPKQSLKDFYKRNKNEI